MAIKALYARKGVDKKYNQWSHQDSNISNELFEFGSWPQVRPTYFSLQTQAPDKQNKS